MGGQCEATQSRTGNRWEHRSTAVPFPPHGTTIYKTLLEAVSVPNIVKKPLVTTPNGRGFSMIELVVLVAYAARPLPRWRAQCNRLGYKSQMSFGVLFDSRRLNERGDL
jgi:hypothetical protein